MIMTPLLANHMCPTYDQSVHPAQRPITCIQHQQHTTTCHQHANMQVLISSVGDLGLQHGCWRPGRRWRNVENAEHGSTMIVKTFLKLFFQARIVLLFLLLNYSFKFFFPLNLWYYNILCIFNPYFEQSVDCPTLNPWMWGQSIDCPNPYLST